MLSIGGSRGVSNVARVLWAYQDFDAGVITGTSVTLTANQNGTSAPFVVGNIVNGSSTLFRLDGKSYAYTGSTRLFSSKVKVVTHSEGAITLSGIPHVSWGAIRVWYQISGVVTSGYSIPPMTVQTEVLAELGSLFEEEENKDTDGTLSANSDTKYPSQKAIKTYIDNVSSSLVTGVSSAFGRTGEVTAQSGDYTKSQVGLSNVDNTSDANKPISTETQTALGLKFGKTTANEISALTVKASLVDNDIILGENSASSFLKIKVTMASIFSYISTRTGTFTNKTLTSPLIPTAYVATTSASANMNVSSTGAIARVTSSSIYKENINTYAKGLTELLQLVPKQYEHIDDPSNKLYAGFIAEDVHALGLSEFVYYDDSGAPDALHYPNMVALITKAIKDLVNTNLPLKANLASPTFTGVVTVPTPTVGASAVTKDYADALVVGLYDDRGNYNASGNSYPASGGSGPSGAILKGDVWTVSVGGTLGGVAIVAGNTVRALVDTPGQTSSNWATVGSSVGYTAESIINYILGNIIDGSVASVAYNTFQFVNGIGVRAKSLTGGVFDLDSSTLNDVGVYSSRTGDTISNPPLGVTLTHVIVTTRSNDIQNASTCYIQEAIGFNGINGPYKFFRTKHSSNPKTGWVQVSTGVPVGALIHYGANGIAGGYLLANGALLSRTTYAAIFAVIGTTHGAGNGSTTFQLPDLRGYFLRGAGTNADGTASGTFGTKIADSFKSHTHTVTDPGHTHSMSPAGSWYYSGTSGRIQNFYTSGYYAAEAASSIVSSTTGITINSTGGTETAPKHIPVNILIKF